MDNKFKELYTKIRSKNDSSDIESENLERIHNLAKKVGDVIGDTSKAALNIARRGKSKIDDASINFRIKELTNNIHKQEKLLAYSDNNTHYSELYLSFLNDLLVNINHADKDNIMKREGLYKEITENWVIDNDRISEPKKKYYKNKLEKLIISNGECENNEQEQDRYAKIDSLKKGIDSF
jgi:hypothetical protein